MRCQWRQHVSLELVTGLALLCFVILLGIVMLMLSGFAGYKIGTFMLGLITRGLQWL